jgi:hypothetical protein
MGDVVVVVVVVVVVIVVNVVDIVAIVDFVVEFEIHFPTSKFCKTIITINNTPIIATT